MIFQEYGNSFWYIQNGMIYQNDILGHKEYIHGDKITYVIENENITITMYLDSIITNWNGFVHSTVQGAFQTSVQRIKMQNTTCICENRDELVSIITDKISIYYDINVIIVSFDGKYIVFLNDNQIYIQNTFQYNLDKLFDISCSDKLFLSRELKYLAWIEASHVLIYGDRNNKTKVYNAETQITHSVDEGYSNNKTIVYNAETQITQSVDEGYNNINYKIDNNLICVCSNCIYVYNIDTMDLIGIIEHNYSFKLWHSVLNVLLVNKLEYYRVNLSNIKLEKIKLGYNYLRDEIYDVVMEIILSAIDLPPEIVNVELYQQIMSTRSRSQPNFTFDLFLVYT